MNLGDGLLLQLENGKPRLVLLHQGEKSGVDKFYRPGLPSRPRGPPPSTSAPPHSSSTRLSTVTSRNSSKTPANHTTMGKTRAASVLSVPERSRPRPRVPSSNRTSKTPANGRTGRTDALANADACLTESSTRTTNQEPTAGSPPLSPDEEGALEPSVDQTPEPEQNNTWLLPLRSPPPALVPPPSLATPVSLPPAAATPPGLGRREESSSSGERVSFLRSMTALLDPAEREERERRKCKQLEQLRAIEAQLAERREQREKEEKQRRKEEEAEEQRKMKEQEGLPNRKQPIGELPRSHAHVAMEHSVSIRGPKGGQVSRGEGPTWSERNAGDPYQEFARTERTDSPRHLARAAEDSRRRLRQEQERRPREENQKPVVERSVHSSSRRARGSRGGTKCQQGSSARGLPAVRPLGPSSPPPQQDYFPYVRTADIIHLEPLDGDGSAPPPPPNTHSQKEILQSLAALRQGLLQKQRELETGVRLLRPVTSHHS